MATRIAFVAAGLVMVAGSAIAQTENKQGPGANPIGVAPSWSTQTTRQQPVVGNTFDEKQIALIGEINAYFNKLTDLKGRFVQTNPDTKTLKGKFFVKKPGRFRFDYSPPSKMQIISDGEYIAIQDLDLKTDDRIALDSTDFRVLLRKDVDILRDAHVFHVSEADGVITIGLQSKANEVGGRMKLVLKRSPSADGGAPVLDLSEWTTTDSQGLETRVQLGSLDASSALEAGMFVPKPISLRPFSQ